MDLVKAVPSLVGPDCYSHQVCANYPTRQSYANHNILLQINLIVSNYFGCGDPLILIFSATATGLITFAEYRQLIDEGDDSAGLTAILDSIESRWAKCDQEVFIAAIILNPICKTAPFANLPILNLAGIYALLCHLWKQFYGTAPPQTLRAELKDYIDNRGAYENLSDWASEVRREAETNVNLQFLLIYVVS